MDKEAPGVIYLQYHTDECEEEVSWWKYKVHETDVKYVRWDMVEQVLDVALETVGDTLSHELGRIDHIMNMVDNTRKVLMGEGGQTARKT